MPTEAPISRGAATAMQPPRPMEMHIIGAKRQTVVLIPRTHSPKLNRMRILFKAGELTRAEAMRRAALELVARPLRLPGGLFLFGTSGTDNLFSETYSDCGVTRCD
jgi:hypothetical protein